jgi:hypothetical protein
MGLVDLDKRDWPWAYGLVVWIGFRGVCWCIFLMRYVNACEVYGWCSGGSVGLSG